MQNSTDPRHRVVEQHRSPLKCEVAHSHEPFWLKDRYRIPQVLVASCEQGVFFIRRQLVGCTVASALFDENQRTIVQDDMLQEKALRAAEAFGEQPPEPAPADFRAVALEARNRPARVLTPGPADGATDAKPIANGGDFAEGNTGLGHAEWTRVHPEKDDSLTALAKSAQVVGVRFPGVGKWVIYVGDGRCELEPVDGRAELLRGANQVLR